jgi:LysR family transcriptional regulator, regulator for genes of the gallate degradation pathway
VPDPFSLNLRHLRALSAIATGGSVRAAADAIGLSQPALTQGLAKLERQIGATLFERRPDGMVPTAAGRVLGERGRAAVARLATALREAGTGGTRGFARAEWLATATQLRAFLALADAGSFVGAAGATGLSQPALHRAVRDLEQVTGLALVERRGRGVAFTAAGRRLARGARLTRSEIAAGLAEIAPDEGGSELLVGAMPLCRAVLLPTAITAFLADAPRTRIDVAEGSWRELVEPLRDGALDLLIGALRDPCPPDLAQELLFVDRLVVVGRAGHPLADDPAPARAALAGYPWIVGRAESPLRAHWEALFAGDARPSAPVECGSVMTTRGLLLRSDCLTLLSPEQVGMEIANGTLVTIGPPLVGHERPIGLTTRADWRPATLHRTFVGHLRAAAAARGLPENEWGTG